MCFAANILIIPLLSPLLLSRFVQRTEGQFPLASSTPRVSHMKRSEIGIKLLKETNVGVPRALFGYFISKRYHLKRNRLDYQPLFEIGARASRARDQRKSSLKPKKKKSFTHYFFECILKTTLTAKNSGVSSSTP